MKEFTFLLKHDNGELKIIAYSKNKQKAINLICNMENCPESALTLLSQKEFVAKAPIPKGKDLQWVDYEN